MKLETFFELTKKYNSYSTEHKTLSQYANDFGEDIQERLVELKLWLDLYDKHTKALEELVK